MTNLEIYRELASRNKTPRIKKFMNLVSLGAFNNELLDLARADEREKLSKEIYSLQREFYTNYGTRITAITVEKLHTILPEKGVEFEMKELWLAMDRNGSIGGYHAKPKLDGIEWFPTDNSLNYLAPYEMLDFGIDVTSFPLTHEKPIKIRAAWEVVA